MTITALIYSAGHFVASGIRRPLAEPNLGQIEEESAPLSVHLKTREPVRTNNPRQYGPMFFFVMDPLLRVSGGDLLKTAPWLYAIQLLSLGAAFAATLAALRRSLDHTDWRWPLTMAWLAILWLNSAPMYSILTVKNVEMWELALVAVALWAYLEGRLWLTAFALTAAALTKLLPFLFFYYLLLRDRRAFAYCLAALLAFLAVGQLLYGWQIGFGYLPGVAVSTQGESWALTWHENISLKAAFVKLLGHLDKRAQLDAAFLASHPQAGYLVRLSPRELRVALALGESAQLIGLGLLTWACVHRADAQQSAQRTVWSWALVTVAMLILSPSTAFEYTILALGASSFVLARLIGGWTDGRATRGWLAFVAGSFLLATFVPRQILNRVTAIDAINRWTGYTHFTASEGYQYYDFPLLGLILLAVAIWQLRPDAVHGVRRDSSNMSVRSPQPR